MVQRLNPGQIQPYPPNASLLFTSEGFDLYNTDPEKRKVLLSDPNGTATQEQIALTFPAYVAAEAVKAEKEIARADIIAAQTRLTEIRDNTTTTAQGLAAIRDMARYMKAIIRLIT